MIEDLDTHRVTVFRELIALFATRRLRLRLCFHFAVEYEISNSVHMRSNNQPASYRRYSVPRGGLGTRRRERVALKYWLHRFRPLLARVKHGDIWR